MATVALVAAFLPLGMGTAGAATFNVDVNDTGCSDILGTPYCSVGAAIAAANSAPGADTINVAAGTYNEGPQIAITDSLTIVGADRATTIMSPTADTSTSGDPRGWFLVSSGVNLDVSEMTFDGNGFQVWQAFRHRGTGTFDTVAFTDITYPNPPGGSPYNGQAIAAFGGAGPVNVLNSTFEDIGRIGVLYFGSGTTGDFVGNTYTGKGTGDYLDYALDISAGAVVNVADNTVTSNRGVASSDGSVSAGFLVTTFFGAGTEATFTENAIDDNTLGIAIGFNSLDSSKAVIEHNTITNNDYGISIVSADAAAAASRANRNAITGNGAGVDNGSTVEVFDAMCNWWGDGFGPSGFGPGSGDSVSDFVDFADWLPTSNLDGACNGGTPFGVKEASVAELGALLPTGDSKTDKRIEKAITRLEASLNPDYWVDEQNLDPKNGKKAFDRERQAVQELMKVDPGVEDVSFFIDAIVGADETLAQTAIDAAITALGDPTKIAKANAEMLKASDEIADGDFDKAVYHYRKAWENAQKALP